MRKTFRYTAILWALLAGLLCVHCAPRPQAATLWLAPASPGSVAAPSQTQTATRTPSPTATPTPAATLTPAASPSLPPSLTPEASITPPGAITGWNLVYQPDENKRVVAAVDFSTDGRSIRYALTPIDSSYLLNWYSYDLTTRATRPLRSPNYGFADLWRNAQLGFPQTRAPISETLGFVSDNFQKAIYPNAGFPDQSANPNYVFVVFSNGMNRQGILGPIFPGTVGRAAWIDFDTRLVFDYRTEDRTILYLADILKRHTITLFELAGSEVEWTVSPNGRFMLVPQGGQSVLFSLSAGDRMEKAPPGAMTRPTWSLDSLTLYYWHGNENRILAYNLSDESVQPILLRRDLEANSPIPPVYGMPFRVSPDGSKIVFWWENWIWVVSRLQSP